MTTTEEVTGGDLDSSADALERMNLVVVGHVDHGKSTVVGRLLADTDSLPDGKIDQVRANCEKTGKQFEYAFLLDALADEQAQGITIDAARIFFKTDDRYYIIIDAPGHIEFLKNMVTGASHAEAALLVIDANEGIQENSRRHGYMLSLLGVDKVIVLINKMDIPNYDEAVFENLRTEYNSFLKSIDVEPLMYIPVSGLVGDNIATASENMPWYKGPTVLSALDSLKRTTASAEGTFRMFVQDVYKFTKYGDTRRIVAGTVESGSLVPGDELIFYPSGKRTSVETIERFNPQDTDGASTDEAIGFTLSEQIYVTRGQLIAKAEELRPKVAERLRVSLFWLGQEDLVKNRDYFIRVGTAKVPAQLESVSKVIDAGNLDQNSSGDSIGRNCVAECVFKLNKAIAFDEVDFLSETSRFVLVDNYRIAGGGIIREALTDSQSDAREKAIQRNTKWISSLISPSARAERYSHKPLLLLITGDEKTDRKTLAKIVESLLFAEGKIVSFLGFGNILYGLANDIDDETNIEQEHIRRFAEVANIMINAGVIFIVSAANLKQNDLELIHTLIGRESVKSVWLGENTTSDAECDLYLPEARNLPNAVELIKEMLYDCNVIFRPW